MTAWQEAMLLNCRAEMEAAIARREGMVAENMQRAAEGKSMAYTEDAFENIAVAIRAAAPSMNGDWS